MICEKHGVKPERIYSACVGCEIESLRNEIRNKEGSFNAMVNESKEVIKHLTADVKLYRKELDELEFANNEWKTADALWKKTVAEMEKEIKWLREERDQLESRLQHYQGSD